jgi:hypothetical protein
MERADALGQQVAAAVQQIDGEEPASPRLKRDFGNEYAQMLLPKLTTRVSDDIGALRSANAPYR